MTDELKSGETKDFPESGGPGEWHKDALDDLSTSLRPGGFGAPGEAPGRVTMVGPDSCPEPGAWLRLVIEGLPEEETEKLLAHAAMCANCLERLRQSRQALSEHASAEEAVDLKRFASSSAHWQRQFAAKLAGTPRKSASRKVLGIVWWILGLALIVGAGFTVHAWWHHRNSPEGLLAEAYTRSRIFDLRVAGAHFAQVLPQTHTGNGKEPSDLRSARTLIENRLKTDPADPQLLHLEARADLLAGKYDTAINILDRLLAQGPVSASLLTDDASAYFQRGVTTGSQNDRITALENLRRADVLAPDDPVVLYNEAVVMEDRGLLSNAADVWNRYLKVEQDAEWQADGRLRLKAVQTKLNRFQSRITRSGLYSSTPRALFA